MQTQLAPNLPAHLATKELRQAANTAVFDKMSNIIAQLYDRWMDEKEYEDFNEYSKCMERILKETCPDVKFIKATKRPFGCQVQIPGMPYQTQLQLANGYLGWAQVKKK